MEIDVDLDIALNKHTEWKTKFRTAISKQETLDAETISKDSCCDFGKWLYGESRATLDDLKSYKECIAKHKIFHIEAGKIATTINLRKYTEAEGMLGVNTSYSNASSETGIAILRLKKEISDASKKSAFFDWSDELSLGNNFIDNDHKKLIQMINNFHNAMQEGRGDDVISKVLNNLFIYTREHFKREEDEMSRIKYPMIIEHRKKHEQLLKQVDDLQNDFNNGKMMHTTKVAKFLKDWLYNHILQNDKLLAEAISKAETLR